METDPTQVDDPTEEGGDEDAFSEDAGESGGEEGGFGEESGGESEAPTGP